MSIGIVLPAYREAENLMELLPAIKATASKIGKPYEILVVDSMEKTDSTESICQLNSCGYINRSHGNSYGDAIRTRINKIDRKYLVVMDSDGSHNPNDIIRLYEEIEKGYDMVIGSCYINGGNSHNGVVLKFMSYILNMTYRFFFRIKARDISNSFRIYKTDQLKQFSFDCDNFDIVEEILIKLSMHIPSFRLSEIPIFFGQRNQNEILLNLYFPI